MTHCRRCQILAWLSCQDKPVTSDQLAKRWGISPRTARRYLKRWEAAGAAQVTRFGPVFQWRAA